MQHRILFCLMKKTFIKTENLIGFKKRSKQNIPTAKHGWHLVAFAIRCQFLKNEMYSYFKFAYFKLIWRIWDLSSVTDCFNVKHINEIKFQKM